VLPGGARRGRSQGSVLARWDKGEKSRKSCKSVLWGSEENQGEKGERKRSKKKLAGKEGGKPQVSKKNMVRANCRSNAAKKIKGKGEEAKISS